MKTRYFAILGILCLIVAFYQLINLSVIDTLPLIFKLTNTFTTLVFLLVGLFCISPVIDKGQFNRDGWKKTPGVRK